LISNQVKFVQNQRRLNILIRFKDDQDLKASQKILKQSRSFLMDSSNRIWLELMRNINFAKYRNFEICNKNQKKILSIISDLICEGSVTLDDFKLYFLDEDEFSKRTLRWLNHLTLFITSMWSSVKTSELSDTNIVASSCRIRIKNVNSTQNYTLRRTRVRCSYSCSSSICFSEMIVWFITRLAWTLELLNSATWTRQITYGDNFRFDEVSSGKCPQFCHFPGSMIKSSVRVAYREQTELSFDSAWLSGEK